MTITTASEQIPYRPLAPTTFREWANVVDILIWRMIGVGSADLPDCNYRDMYDDGETPKAAARTAVRNAF